LSNPTAEIKSFGILGSPVKHTLSPRMHKFIAENEGIDISYIPYEVLPCELHNAMKDFKEKNVSGFNITAPHKIMIIKELDEVETSAARMNSVNTIVNRNGKWCGYNTDGDGFCVSLMLEGCEIKGKNILVIGAGGAARAVCYKLAEYGAQSITITSRTAEKIHIIGKMVKEYSNTQFFEELDTSKHYDIIINSTPLGMFPKENENPCTFMEIIDENTVCCDLIYNPSKTIFLKEAEKKGAKILNGLGMLVLQGILAFELFNDVKLDHKRYYEELSHFFDDFRI